MTGDEQRAELAAALRDELTGWPIGSGYYATSVGSDDAREMVNALMPVVDRIATARAATELRAAAGAMTWPNSQNCGPELRDRADALDPKPTERTCSAGVPRSSCCGLPGACGDC